MIKHSPILVLAAAACSHSVAPTAPTGVLFIRAFDPTQAVVVRPGELTAPRTVRENAMFGSFSRDGQRIVYTSKIAGSDRTHNEIFTMNADGSSPTQVTFPDDDDAPDANASSWSPDGNTIAFFCGHEGDLPADQLDPYYREGKQQVCLIDADGGNRRTLTHCTNVIEVGGTNEAQLLDVSYGGGRLPWME